MANRLSKLVKSEVKKQVVDAGMPVADSSEQRRYKAQDALNTLCRAEQIRKDRPLMADVKKLVNDQTKLIKR